MSNASDTLFFTLEAIPVNDIPYNFSVGVFPEEAYPNPFIYEDRLSGKQVSEGLMKMYELGPEKRAELGKAGRQHVLKNYNFNTFNNRWVKIMTELHEEHGSWETRTAYDGIRFKEVA